MSSLDKNQNRTRVINKILWMVAVLAVLSVVALYLYGKSIHDSLALLG